MGEAGGTGPGGTGHDGRGGADPAHGLGFGLPLVRDIARRDGGDVWVADPGGPPPDAEAGAVFCARLAGVVEPPDADPPAADPLDPDDLDPHGARA
ncbi:hypothetical protein [Clavibacter capsici]|uniref:hypothetical protein n=1 Tax=Clavibacter capsici TaxID=1874630 RepID=UPI00287B5F9A|nr:hypothetical protein [Clavibacter capsici]